MRTSSGRPWNEDLEWFDYVAEKGVVLRTFRYTRDRRDAENTPISDEIIEERLELTAIES